jgi:hypothetical protein
VVCQRKQALQLNTYGVIMLCLVRAISHFRKAMRDEYRTKFSRGKRSSLERNLSQSNFIHEELT